LNTPNPPPLGAPLADMLLNKSKPDCEMVLSHGL